MSAPYTKYQLGNKLFMIEWVLDPTQSGGLDGAYFEMKDARLLSLQAHSSSAVEIALRYSFFQTPNDFEYSFSD